MPVSWLWMSWKPGDVRGSGEELSKGREQRGVGSLRVSAEGTLKPSRGRVHCMVASEPAVATTPLKRRLSCPHPCSRSPCLHLMTPPPRLSWTNTGPWLKGSQSRVCLWLSEKLKWPERCHPELRNEERWGQSVVGTEARWRYGKRPV